MYKFQLSQSIGDIVASMPKASDLFKEYHIDFCCGGHRPLAEAIRDGNLDEHEILEKNVSFTTYELRSMFSAI